MSGHLRELLAGFDPTLPLERARTIPSSWYRDRELAETERRAVFGNTWQLAARADQLAVPGAFRTLDVAGEPVLLVRGDDETLRAFSNVCRHRAARVIDSPEGCATKLRCRYHGWTYDLAGRLRGTPEFGDVADFDREDQGLVPLSVAAWSQFVWVHAGEQPVSLEDYVAPLAKRLGGLGLETLRFVERREYELACNWKVFVDNYLDGGYHVNTIHPGLASVLNYTHYRNEADGPVNVQIAPLESTGSATSAVRPGDAAYYAWIFPNTMFNVYQGVMDINQVFPIAEESCRVIFDFYFSETEGPGVAERIAKSIAVSDQIQQEDVGICEDVQRGLASRSYRAGRFSVRREAAVYQFHRMLEDYLTRYAESPNGRSQCDPEA